MTTIQIFVLLATLHYLMGVVANVIEGDLFAAVVDFVMGAIGAWILVEQFFPYEKAVATYSGGIT